MSTLSLTFILMLLLIIIIPILVYTFFFLKRQPASSSAAQPLPPRAANHKPELATVVVASSETDTGSECPVCLSAMEEGVELWRLNLCSHVFHAPCIQRWLDAHPDCPVCRAYVKPPPKRSIVVPATRHQEDHWQGLPDSAGLV